MYLTDKFVVLFSWFFCAGECDLVSSVGAVGALSEMGAVGAVGAVGEVGKFNVFTIRFSSVVQMHGGVWMAFVLFLC